MHLCQKESIFELKLELLISEDTVKINFSNLRISDDNIITEHIDWDTSTKVAFERDLPVTWQLLLKWVYPERGSDL